ncbi:MAG: homoserine dehydrogenase [Planctomycetota bacterium]
MPMERVTLGLIGAGNIGQGVLRVIEENGDLIRAKAGIELHLKTIADKCIDERKGAIRGDLLLTDDVNQILDDDEIGVVIELIGGLEPARTYILDALRRKKHVVTANKAVVSQHYGELMEAAKENGVNIKFEASAGGCVPIIKSLKESLVADEITSLYGILNGTTNFILTRMSHGSSYGEALQEAQDLGFAEPDPSFDVSGMDAAQKLVILALMAFNIRSDISKVYVEGIERIDKKDIDYANELGYAIKLLAIAKRHGDKAELRVHPVLIHKDHLLADVRNELNAVFVKGRFIDEQMYYGKGAGQMPTAAAVVGDVVGVVLQKEHGRDFEDVEFVSIDDIESHYYVRFTVLEQVGVLATITKILAENDISILSVVQKETKMQTVPVMMLTHVVKESSLRKAIGEIDGQSFVRDASIVIRIEGELV